MRGNQSGLPIVIWDNGPAHGGDALRELLATPDLHRCLVRLPDYSPEFNADEASWGWVREHVGRFFRDLTGRAEAVKRLGRTVLQARAEALASIAAALLQDSQHAGPTLALA